MGVSNHWIGIRTGMEWNGMDWNDTEEGYAFSFIVVLYYKRLYLYCIVLWVVNVYIYVLKWYIHIAKINYSFKTRYYLYCS